MLFSHERKRTMPLDINLLYGEMAGSWIAHLAIPFGTAMLVRNIGRMPAMTKVLIFLAICTGLSFICQFAFLAILQSSSCAGVSDYGKIGVGAAIAASITAAMIAIPVFIEPMRLVVSNLFISHKALLTPELAKINDILTKAGDDVLKASMSADAVQKGGAAITPEEYDDQTFQEISVGASYWSAFAGAYGIGIGSLTAATCSATS